MDSTAPMKKRLEAAIVTLLLLTLAALGCDGPARDDSAARGSDGSTVGTGPAPEATAQALSTDLPPVGRTLPAPIFQRGNTLPEPRGGPDSGFLDFLHAHYIEPSDPGIPKLPELTRDDVVWFPPHTLNSEAPEQAVFRLPPNNESLGRQMPLTPEEILAHGPGRITRPGGYPIITRPPGGDDGAAKGDFSTSLYCQECHDSAGNPNRNVPEMSYYSEDEKWVANWSLYGDWSTSIMGLATRDPIWQAQIETETNVHQGADPGILQDICFRCHGAMGERQLMADFDDADFCTDVFYATIDGTWGPQPGPPNTGGPFRGKPFPFSEDCAPIAGRTVHGNGNLYAKYGALARDGVSCEVCHRLGPPAPTDGSPAGHWNGTDFSVFYGHATAAEARELEGKQTENEYPLQYPFTAEFDYDQTYLNTPDPIEVLDTTQMREADNLELGYGFNEKDNVTYLRQAVVCGACHVLIVPQIPSSYEAGAAVPPTGRKHGVANEEFPFYTRPTGCGDGPKTFNDDRNPVTDPCVSVAYEQATYLEWINSDFATETDASSEGETCQSCHMPWVSHPDNVEDHGAILAQNYEVDGEQLTPKQYRRHRMMGINLFVLEMFAQFPGVLGVEGKDPKIVPSYALPDGSPIDAIEYNILNGEMAIVEQATSQAFGNGLNRETGEPEPRAAAEISVESIELSQELLAVDLLVTNNTGHKFPSGAGFRRAFIELEVLDESGNVLWVSGQPNEYGAICEGVCAQQPPYNILPSEAPANGDPINLQPHYETITAQDQVQIYEVKTVNDRGALTSSTLALFYDAKDNRILPRGWTSTEDLGCAEGNDPRGQAEIFGITRCQAAGAAHPQVEGPLTRQVDGKHPIQEDPHYTDSRYSGSDAIRYRIDAAEVTGAREVRATLRYQTIPPDYLAARFRDGYDKEKGAFLPATERAIFLTSNLNLDLGLTSTHPDNEGLPINEGWTMNIHQVSARIGGAR